ncbi:30S ribosomal protein S8 [Candidatus Shapirobacteria bacterium]|nr:MAG: 30S ribosomal protein S8 [Candidatus Shapirobacteria bacterium]
MLSSPIIDFLIRIKNAYAVNKKMVVSPSSKFKVAVAQLLVDHSYLKSFKIEGEKKKTITLQLSYPSQKKSLHGLKIYSKPGRRLYHSFSTFPWAKHKKSIIIISTSKGILSHRQAIKAEVGGELIAELW